MYYTVAVCARGSVVGTTCFFDAVFAGGFFQLFFGGGEYGSCRFSGSDVDDHQLI